MAKMQDFTKISLWDICHYWHGYNPQTTLPSRLPTKVQMSIRSLALKLSKTLYFRINVNTIPYRVFYEEPTPVRYIARIYQRELENAYTGKRYKKKFLQSIEIGRLSLLKWCQETSTPAPSFWFDENDPILAKPVESPFFDWSEDEKRKHGYFALFETAESEPKVKATSQSSDINPSSFDSTEFKEKDNIIKKALSELNSKNAKSRYVAADKIKSDYKDFFRANRSKYKYKSHAARDFFNSLNEKDKKEIVPTYFEMNHERCLEKAVLNLNKILKY